MFLGLCALVVVVLVPLTGGSVGRLADLRLRWLPLAVGALGLQILVMNIWPRMPHDLAVSGHLVSYLMLGAVVWVNRRLPGMLIIGLGAGLNAIAITANGGTLPASKAALRASGIVERRGFHNSGLVAHPHLTWLGDIMVTPTWLPFRNMLSIGDIVLVIGAMALVWVATHRPAGRAVPEPAPANASSNVTVLEPATEALAH